MSSPSRLTDAELLERMPRLVLAERAGTADVIEHLVEIDQRRLFLDQACRSLSCYCIERLGYSEDEAGKRVTAARAASRFPGLLAELRSGTLHLTGLCQLAQYLTPENYDALVGHARGKSRRQIEELVARLFPRPDVPARICLVPEQTSALLLMSPGAGGATETGPASSAPPIRTGTGLVRPLPGSF